MTKLKDGVEFKIGMTIYYPDLLDYDIKEVNTSNPSRTGADWTKLGDYIRGGGFTYEYIPHYYSTREAALNALIASIKKQIYRLSKAVIVLEQRYGE